MLPAFLSFFFFLVMGIICFCIIQHVVVIHQKNPDQRCSIIISHLFSSYCFRYNVGWVILDGNDPKKILQRSETPLLTPKLAWENGTGTYLGLTPNVIFIEGWMAHPSQIDSFIVFYGAADAYVGSALITVEKNKK